MSEKKGSKPGVRALLQHRGVVIAAVAAALAVVGWQVAPMLMPKRDQAGAVDPAAPAYAKASPIALIRVHQAITCFQAGAKGMPASIEQLEASGCLKPDTPLEPAPEAALRMIDVSASKEWKRLKGVLIRCAGETELEDDAIIAVTLPLTSDSECVYGVDRSGRLTRVERADWSENLEECRRRVGDLTLW